MLTSDVKTVILDDGYNGHTIECDASPILIEGSLAKVRVTGSDYLVKWCTLEDLEDAKAARGREIEEAQAAHLSILETQAKELLRRYESAKALTTKAYERVQRFKYGTTRYNEAWDVYESKLVDEADLNDEVIQTLVDGLRGVEC